MKNEQKHYKRQIFKNAFSILIHLKCQFIKLFKGRTFAELIRTGGFNGHILFTRLRI